MAPIGLVKLNNRSGKSGGDSRLDTSTISALDATHTGAQEVNLPKPGGRGAFRFVGGVEPFVNGAGNLRAGQTVEIITPGAGGYGSPTYRDHAAVERELDDQRIE